MFLIISAAVALVGLIVGLSIFIFKLVFSPKKLSAIDTMIKQGRVAAAVHLARTLINQDSRNAAAHYYLALAYLADAKQELALMELKTVSQLSQFGPDLPEIDFRALIAGLYEHFGQPEEALKEYIMLTKLKPDAADYFLAAGRLFDERMKPDIAVGYLKRCVAIDPRNAEAHLHLGHIFYRGKRPAEAKTELELALRYDPNQFEAFYYIGRILKEAGDHTGALIAFEKAMREPELKIKCLVERGGSYMSVNAIDKAIPELERAVKLIKDESASESLYCRFFLAMCYERTQNIDKAIDQWEKIYQKKPQFRDVAEKLTQYQEYRTDDHMKDFLTSGKDLYLEICRGIASQAMGLSPKDISEIPGGLEMLATESESERWLGAKRQPTLILFLRMSDPIDDASVRLLLEKIKSQGIVKGSIVSSSGFSRSAKEYAENRPVTLVGKEELQAMLAKLSIPHRKSQ